MRHAARRPGGWLPVRRDHPPPGPGARRLAAQRLPLAGLGLAAVRDGHARPDPLRPALPSGARPGGDRRPPPRAGAAAAVGRRRRMPAAAGSDPCGSRAVPDRLRPCLRDRHRRCLAEPRRGACSTGLQRGAGRLSRASVACRRRRRLRRRAALVAGFSGAARHGGLHRRGAVPARRAGGPAQDRRAGGDSGRSATGRRCAAGRQQRRRRKRRCGSATGSSMS